MEIKQIDHLCIAVKDLMGAKKTFDLLGLELARSYMEKLGGKNGEDFYMDEKEGYRSVAYKVGDCVLEILESTSPDGEIAKFIQRRGEGIYLVSFRVSNVVEALKELEQKGIRLIDKEPRSLYSAKYAFVHPKAFSGVMLELIEWKG